ncbi:hybrid sensor histidine kinase/response regulator [Parachryseolinea silvisoli]|uniref:hybrid sensor histidine kinase/response regulator n=1 Tax=Parachryseolinea silvisoli TaxID=2873601 RepID=UPI002265EFC1|nr:response regulator [Parachryseolinea silvisoli]MCD9013988.1 response regulator [Parachryseolinea silvisoli]
MKNPDAPEHFVKLLVIDDDEVDKRQLKRALKASGFEYELTEYSDALSIADISLLNAFDCIFLDYLLPGDTGLRFLKKIRDEGIVTPIVMITSQGNESIAVELMKAGASDYIVKNEIDGQSISQVLRNMFRLNSMMREREEAYCALRISEARLAEAQELAKIGSWEFDAKKNSFYVSPEIYNILELDPQTPMTFEMYLAVVHPDEREKVDAAWRGALEGKPYNMDVRINPPSGVKYAHAQGRYIPDSTGALEKMMGTFQDITDRKLFEQEMMRARELAENSMKVKEIFLANMSHEIRTPMNAILGFTRLLFETPLTAEQKSYIDAIHFSGENLLVIINDILDLSKIQSGKTTLEKSVFNIRELVNGIVGLLRPKALEKGISLTSIVHHPVPTTIKGDPVRLNQILTNLISNGIKFTEKGGVTLEINSSAPKKHQCILEFKVRDTGIGIPADKHATIFESFVQASSDTTKKYGGTGLGLAIVKNLVELQDGKISLSSTDGHGSTFTVHLPCEEVTQENKQHQSSPLRTSPAVESLEQLIGAEILVVEDNPLNQMLARKVLQKAGCNVDIASNGLQALERIKMKQYEVILMDIQMPEMDGFETTRHVRTQLQPPVSEVPIIAMTAHAFGSDVAKCLAVGMNDYISKPFKADDLYLKLLKFVQPSPTRVVPFKRNDALPHHKIDLSALHELAGDNDVFIDELVLEYNRQTPAFVEKLKGYTKSQNFEAIRFICHQIRYSYGILSMAALDKALDEISTLLKMTDPGPEMTKVIKLVNTIISLISAINEAVTRGLRRTG